MIRPSRRDVLALASALLATAVTGPARAQGARGIVIGAGIAGLAAARALREFGAEPVILEARDRIGGRIVTDRTWADCPADLGASWLHGTDENPIVPVIRNAKLKMQRTHDDDAVIRLPTGAEADGEAYSALMDLESLIDDLVADPSCQGAGSIVDAVKAADPELFAAAGPLAALALYNAVGGDWAADPSDLSACRLGDDEAYGGYDVMLPGGFDGITTHLAAGLDIRLGVTVTSIRKDGPSLVIETSAGPVEADYAIVTVPLGVLKAGTIAFEPGLPAEVTGAIERLGAGALAKTFVRFPEVFWDDSTVIQRGAESDGWFDFLNMNRVAKAPVLVSFCAGSFAREVEAMSDTDAEAAIHEVMKGLYGTSVPAPVGLRRHAWTRDPLAGLSYSYPSLATGADDRAALAARFDDRIILAGEHVSTSHPGTVHGALVSGVLQVKALFGS
ncbi:flavin monoamine oxidase family protein [Chthonobacter albigriseus]|uniref:flavin monoamine oxidase family protein n=1 Tax=Chthonobacter albigriseus TaxID=1683161 RepID=UPI001FCE99C9|nr:FAD-dependent oxidoreductase [Chthonobacter albigriseus]